MISHLVYPFCNALFCSYVGNLSHQVTEHFINVLFSQMGTCLGCKMIYEVGFAILRYHGFLLILILAYYYVQ